MNARNKILYLLVKRAQISKREATLALENGRVKLNQKVCYQNEFVGPYDSLFLDEICLLDGTKYAYYKLYKPAGIECTLQANISNSLKNFLGEKHQHLFYIGRLDKNSEGLLLLSNDGYIYNKIIDPKHLIEKEYLVRVESPLAENFKEKMENGVAILGTITKTCKVKIIDNHTFSIILTQGLNRQIRRMCFALGNYVVFLKRIAIGKIALGTMEIGEMQALDQTEIQWLRNLT